LIDPMGGNKCFPHPKKGVWRHVSGQTGSILTPKGDKLAARTARRHAEASAQCIEMPMDRYSASGWTRRNHAPSKKHACDRNFCALEKAMRALVRICFALALIASSFSCNRSKVADLVYDRDGDGRPDEWVYRLSKTEVKKEFDTNGDGRPDVTKFYHNDQLIRVERDRNFDGVCDLVVEYDHGVVAREVHDDDFDGKPETIKIFRKGKLAILELDPLERGAIDIAEYYADDGHLLRREVRKR